MHSSAVNYLATWDSLSVVLSLLNSANMLSFEKNSCSRASEAVILFVGSF